MTADAHSEALARLDSSSTPSILVLHGDWTGDSLPAGDSLNLDSIAGEPLRVNAADVTAWDSRLPAFILGIQRRTQAYGGEMDLQALPEGLHALLSLASAVPLYSSPPEQHKSLFSRQRVRSSLADIGDDFIDSLGFLGDTLRAVARTLVGRGAMRGGDLLASCYRSGPDALGIIALTSILVGMILAYLGAEQLRQFGAAIYVADLVAIGMLREMGALMTAIVMAGRTGAAYAAELSSMQGNEEVDAISTMGIEPIEFLVVPRVIALCVTMPLLVIFADVLGIIGGGLVAGGMGVTPLQYLSQLEGALAPSHFFVGMGKSLVFALLIAIAGCRAGMQAGRSSEGVGKATTDAVVTAVVYLIVADAAANILFQQLDI